MCDRVMSVARTGRPDWPQCEHERRLHAVFI